LIDDCEARGDRIALLDPPCGERALDVPALISWRARLDSSYAALHAPWLQVLDPLASTPGQPPTPWGDLRRLPPSGHVAGLLAQVDADTGPWHAPANRMLSWVHQADMVLDDAGHGRLNAAGIDALRALKSRGVAVLGARTVSSDPSWLFLGTRRLFLMLERTFRVGLAWTAFEPAGPRLEKLMASVIGGLLSDLFDRGAFGGSSPQTSFFVQTGGGDPLIGEVIVEIGIVPAPPAEVILLQVVRTANQLELREQPKRSA
jgi:phage tail sheath protein FI